MLPSSRGFLKGAIFTTRIHRNHVDMRYVRGIHDYIYIKVYMFKLFNLSKRVDGGINILRLARGKNAILLYTAHI